MTRAELKNMFGDIRPSPIRPEMFDDPLVRRMLRMSEKARLRYEQDKRELYSDRSLTDEQRTDGVWRALERYRASWKQRAPLEREYERRMLQDIREMRRNRRARRRTN